VTRERQYLDGEPVPRGISVSELVRCAGGSAGVCALEDALAAATAAGAAPGLGWDVADALRALAREVERETERRQELAEAARREREDEEERAYLAAELDAILLGTFAAIELMADADERSAAE
jgi:hypothetical protein